MEGQRTSLSQPHSARIAIHSDTMSSMSWISDVIVRSANLQSSNGDVMISQGPPNVA
jgi:hypothetical protein